jgi:hypothetical protein
VRVTNITIRHFFIAVLKQRPPNPNPHKPDQMPPPTRTLGAPCGWRLCVVEAGVQLGATRRGGYRNVCRASGSAPILLRYACGALRTLVHYCGNVMDEGLRAVSSLTALAILDLAGCSNEASEGLCAVSSLRTRVALYAQLLLQHVVQSPPPVVRVAWTVARTLSRSIRSATHPPWSTAGPLR